MAGRLAGKYAQFSARLAALAGMDYLVAVYVSGTNDLCLYLHYCSQPNRIAFLWPHFRESNFDGPG